MLDLTSPNSGKKDGDASDDSSCTTQQLFDIIPILCLLLAVSSIIGLYIDPSDKKGPEGFRAIAGITIAVSVISAILTTTASQKKDGCIKDLEPKRVFVPVMVANGLIGLISVILAIWYLA